MNRRAIVSQSIMRSPDEQNCAPNAHRDGGFDRFGADMEPVPMMERADVSKRDTMQCGNESWTTAKSFVSGRLQMWFDDPSTKRKTLRGIQDGNDCSVPASCAGLGRLTGRQSSQQISGQARRARAFRREQRQPVFRGDTVTLPPFGNLRCSGAWQFDRQRFTRSSPELDDVSE